MKDQEIICIQCPLGCHGRVTTDETNKVVTFEGYECKEGKKYAESEALEPLRILTATVITESKIRPLLPVKTNKAIPKNKLKQCMRVLARVRAKPPVSMGHVIVPNILDTGADIVIETDLPV
jgi:CxxC motif-containing protein